MFTSDKRYWLNAFPFGNEELRTPDKLEQDTFPFHERYGGECPGVYYVRLQRDGWRLVRRERHGADHSTIFEKQVATQWILEKTAHETSSHTVGRGCYFDTHRLKKIMSVSSAHSATQAVRPSKLSGGTANFIKDAIMAAIEAAL